MINKLKNLLDFEVNNIQFRKEGQLVFLDIELPVKDLKEIEEKSKIISKILDEIDKTNEQYYLNVYSSGTEKNIEIKNICNYINKHVSIELKKHLLNKNVWEGMIIDCNENELNLKVNNKGRFQKLKIEINQITSIKETAKLTKGNKHDEKQ